MDAVLPQWSGTPSAARGNEGFTLLRHSPSGGTARKPFSCSVCAKQEYEHAT